MNRDIPYTSSDLRDIADRVDEILTAVGDDTDMEDNDWRWGLRVTVFVEDYKVGYIAPYSDGWLGFYPSGMDEK